VLTVCLSLLWISRDRTLVSWACGLDELPLPHGYSLGSSVSGGDPTGRYIVGAAEGPGSLGKVLLLWDNNRVTAIKPEGTDVKLTDVNSSGVAVGSALTVDGRRYSFLYRDGSIAEFHGGTAVAINAAGVSVGYAGTRPALWSHPAAEPMLLPLPGDEWRGEALDIGDDGVIVGTVSPPAPSTSSRAYVWLPDGTHYGLPGGASIAVSYRDGWAVGQSAHGPDVALLWHRTAVGWNTFASIGISPKVVNAQGWIAGIGAAAVKAHNEIGLKLPVELPGHRAGAQPEIDALSDNARSLAGTIAVSPYGKAEPDHVAVRWTCGEQTGGGR
jgi:hypothetical protein